MKLRGWVLLATLVWFPVGVFWNPVPSSASSAAVRYVPLGDSYTRGKGVQPEDTWPMLLTRHLQAEGIEVTERGQQNLWGLQLGARGIS